MIFVVLILSLTFFSSLYASSSISFSMKNDSLVESSNGLTIHLKPMDIDRIEPLRLTFKFDSSDPMINTENQKRIILLNDSSWVNWQDVTINAGYGVARTCDISINTNSLQFTGIDTLVFLAQVIKTDSVVRKQKLRLIIPFLPYIEQEPQFTRGDTNVVKWHRSRNLYDQYITYNGVTNSFTGNALESWTDPMVTVFENLKDGKTYKYQIEGVTVKGNRHIYSRPQYSTQDATPPSPCNSLDVYTIGGETSYLSWKPVRDFDSESGVDFYKILTIQNEDGIMTTSFDRVKADSDSVYMFEKKIDPTKTYFFEVHAVDKVGNEGMGKRSEIVRFIQEPEFCNSNIDYKAGDSWTYSSLISTDSGYVKRLKLSKTILNEEVVPDSFRVEVARDSSKFFGTKYGQKTNQYIDFAWRSFAELKDSLNCLSFDCNLGKDINWINNHKYYFKVTYKDKFNNYSDSNTLTITRIDVTPPAPIELNHVWTVKDKNGKSFIEVSWYEGKDAESGLKRYFYYRKIGQEGSYEKKEMDIDRIQTHIRPDGRKAFYYQESYDSIGVNDVVYYKVGAVDNVGNALRASDIPNQPNYEMSIRCFYPPTLALVDSVGYQQIKDTLRCDCSEDNHAFNYIAVRWSAKNISEIAKVIFSIQTPVHQYSRQIAATQDTIHVPINFISGIVKVNAQFKYLGLSDLSPNSNSIIIDYHCRSRIDVMSYKFNVQRLRLKWHGPNNSDSTKKYIVRIDTAKCSKDITDGRNHFRLWEGYGDSTTFGSMPPLGAGYFYFARVKAIVGGDTTIWSPVDSCEALATVCQELPQLDKTDVFVSDLPFKGGIYLNWGKYTTDNKNRLKEFNKVIYKITRGDTAFWTDAPFFRDSTSPSNKRISYKIAPAVVSVNVPPDTFVCSAVTTYPITNHEDLTFIPVINSSEYDSTKFSIKHNSTYYFNADTLPVFWKPRHENVCNWIKYYGLDRLIYQASNNLSFKDNVYKNQFVVSGMMDSLQNSLHQPIPQLVLKGLNILSGDTLYLRLSGYDPWGNPDKQLWSDTLMMVKDAVPPAAVTPKIQITASEAIEKNTLDFDFKWNRPLDMQSGLYQYRLIVSKRDTSDPGRYEVLFDDTLTTHDFNSKWSHKHASNIKFECDTTTAGSRIIDHFKVVDFKLDTFQTKGYLKFNIQSVDRLNNIQKYNSECLTPDLFLAPKIDCINVAKDSFKFCWNKILFALKYRINIVDDESLSGKPSPNDTTVVDTVFKNSLSKLQGRAYWFKVKAILPFGETGWSNTIKVSRGRGASNGQIVAGIYSSDVPKQYALFPSYPNPFNPQTTISYQLPKDTNVQLIIFNVLGKLTKVLVEGKQPAGVYHVTWNGTDNLNNPVAAGLYFYILHTPEYTAKGKCLLIK